MKKSEIRQLIGVLRETNVWRLYVYLLIYMTTVSMFIALIPNLETNFFASQEYGSNLNCQDHGSIDTQRKKECCRDAHGTAVWWDARSSFLCYTILNSFIAPTIGHFADLYGRKPFLILSQVFSLLPMGILLAYYWGKDSFILYYPSYAITNALQPLSVGLAYIADIVVEEHRSSIFGIALCCLTLGTAIAAPIGAALGLELAILTCVVLILINVVYLFVFVPESLSMDQRRRHQIETKHNQLGFMRKAIQGLISATKIIVRSSLFIKLTVCIMTFGIVFEGLLDLLRQYLQLILHFNADEQSILFIVLGLVSTATLLFVLQPLTSSIGLVHTLQIGVLCTFLQVLIMVFSHTKWEAYASMVFAGVGSIQIPIIGAIVANNATDTEQGTVQGAMFGAKSLAQGLGPLLFAYLFSTFTQTEDQSKYFPQAPMIFGSIMMFVSLVVSLLIPSDNPHRQISQREFSDGSLDVEVEKTNGQSVPNSVHAPLLRDSQKSVQFLQQNHVNEHLEGYGDENQQIQQ